MPILKMIHFSGLTTSTFLKRHGRGSIQNLQNQKQDILSLIHSIVSGTGEVLPWIEKMWPLFPLFLPTPSWQREWGEIQSGGDKD